MCSPSRSLHHRPATHHDHHVKLSRVESGDGPGEGDGVSTEGCVLQHLFWVSVPAGRPPGTLQELLGRPRRSEAY
jgi:hypothetical protein